MGNRLVLTEPNRVGVGVPAVDALCRRGRDGAILLAPRGLRDHDHADDDDEQGDQAQGRDHAGAIVGELSTNG